MISAPRRPDWIAAATFRAWLKTSALNRVAMVDGMFMRSFVDRCARKGRPIRSVGGAYRPVDVWARARADGVSFVEIRYEEAAPQIEPPPSPSIAPPPPRAAAHVAEAMRLSIEATGARLLSEEEIVSAANLLPRASGIYFLVAAERVVYVGQSVNVFSRVATHATTKTFSRVAFIPCPPERLDVMEALYIHALRPPLNGKGRSGVPFAPLPLSKIISAREAPK